MVEAKEYSGKWRILNSNIWFDGFLTFSPELGAKLKIFGSFKEHHNDSTKKLIIGQTNEGDLTLLNSYHRKTSTGNSIVTETYEPSIIFEGICALEETQLSFCSTIFRAHNLFQWFDLSGLKITNEGGNSKSYSIDYKSNENIDFYFGEVDSGYISFDAPLTTNGINNRIELFEQSYVTFEYSKPTNYFKILTDISKFISFLTLVTFEQSFPLNIILLDETETSKRKEGKVFESVKCIYKHTKYNEKHKIRKSWYHLLSYNDISKSFPEIIMNWFNVYHEMDSVITLLTNFFRNKYLFSEERFMECIRAIESFHRINYENRKLPKNKYKELVSQVITNSNLKNDDLKWLEAKLMGNEPSLAMRLDELTRDYKNSFVSENLDEKTRRDAKNSRNYYTHFDKNSEKKALKGFELSGLTNKLRGLLISALLTKLGIDHTIFEDNLKYRLK